MKKRILSLLLAVVMIMSFIPPVHVHAADDCIYLMYWGSHQYGYSYTDNKDGTHSQKCQGCDETKTDNHTYGNWTNDSWAGNHYRECTECGAKETADHTMGYKKGTWAGTHVYGCTVCSYTEGNSYGTDCASSTWLKTDAEHYKKCDTCGLEFARESHSGSVTNNGASGHTIGCSTCGKGVTEKHTMGNWTSGSGDQHTRTCTVNGCGYTEKENHSLKYTGTDGSERHTVACEDCNYKRSNVSCTLGNSYVQGETQHWKVCSLCKTKGTMTNHSGTVQKIKGDSTHHKVTCSACNKVATVECTFGSWQNAGDGKHEATCTEWNCGNTKSEAHTLQYTGTDDYDYHSVSCKTCSYNQYNEKCTLTGSYVQGETQHWKVCSLCKTKGTMTDHSGDVTSNGKTGHTISCEDCGKSVSEDHTLSNWANDYMNDQHKRTCTVSGCTYEETAKHTPKYSGTDGSTSHKVTCTDCNTTINHSESCTFSGSYEKNDTQHWKVCSLCKTKGTMTDHSGDVTSNGASGHTIGCSTCGKSTSEDHKLGNWTDDNWNDNHYRECTVNGCDYKETGDHGNWTYEQYSSDRHLKKCGTCSYSEYEDCDKSYTDNEDGKTHTVTCENCEKTNNKENHNFDFNTKTCVCDAVKHDHQWKLVASGNKITLTCTETLGTCIDNLGELTISAPADLTYDGNAKTATVGVTSGSYMAENGSYTVSYQYKSGSSYYTASEVKNAGDYRATVTYRLNNGAYEEATVDFTVQKAKLTVTAKDKTVPYDGNAHGIVVEGLEGTDLKAYFGETASSCNNTTYTKTNAGEYEIFYEVRGDYFSNSIDNYDITGKTGSAKLTINATNLEDAVKVIPHSGTYDGKPHGITVEVPDDATVYYKTSADGEWNNWPNQNPTFTDVGDYTVYYKVVSKSGNYFAGKARAAEVSVEGSSTVKITPFDLKTVVNAESTEFTYNRNNWTNIDYNTVYHSIKLSVGETPDSVTVEFSVDGGTTWVSEYNNPKFTDAGVYPVKYRVYVKDQPFSDTESKNYVKAEGEKTVTINKAELPFDALHGYKGPYDGSTHYVFGHVEYVNGDWGYTYWTTYWWWLDDLTYEFEWTDDNGVAQKTTVTGKDNFLNYRKVPGFTKQNVSDLNSDEPGKVVKVKVSGKNYITEDFTYNVKIGPGRAWAADRTYVYDGDKHYIANYIAGLLFYGYYEDYNFGSIKIRYKEHGTDEWLYPSQEPGQTEVGFKDVDWMVIMDSDGDGEFGEEKNSFGSPEIFTGTNRVTVTQAELTATAGNKNITYGDPAPAYDVSISGFVASENNSVLDDAEPEFECDYVAGKPVGTYSITPKGLNDNNYKFKYVPGTLTVEPKSLPIKYDGTKTGDERFSVDDKSLVAGDECEIGTVKYFDEDGKEVSNPTEAGTYTAKFTLTGKDAKNYIPQDKDFTIQPTTPPAPSKPDLTVTAKNHTITYGSEPANNGVTITGLVDSDTEESVKAGLNYAYSYSKGDDVGTYEIEPKGLTTTKYDVVYQKGALTVTKKPVGIRLAEGSMVPSVFPADVLEGDTCDITGYEYYQGNTKLDAAPTAPGTYKIKVTGLSNDNYMPANEVEFTIAAPTPDEQAPTGNINVSTYNWNAFQNDVTFAIYFNEAQMVTITAADDKGVKSIEYFVSPTARSLTDVQSKTEGWAPYTASFAITPNQKVVVYAKITDTSDNVTYISSNGMIFDSAAPVVDGIDDGKKYSKDVEFTVTDNFKLDKVLVDGEKIEANDDGTYTIKYDGKKHTIVAIDEAGNKTELTITMRKTAAKDDDSPATGDEFNFVLWGFAMVASAAALLFVTMKKKSSNSKRRSRR